ncbi:Small secreted domain [Streptomyces sp. 2323.1]|uniref:chaplin n=1 Tax=Streptomyces sp. 2323.1 TaxID=1938841 RepID=UPI000BB9B7F2|nr:chaplin [Streptomyces sp. 2323.1]SOE14589.1 Small secreted domain [Streptomyces sp. 2323.1]
MNTAKKAALVLATTGLALGAAAGSAFAAGEAAGAATKSPGIGSGNLAQVPVHVPVNATGNTVNVVGVLNPAVGNFSANN